MSKECDCCFISLILGVIGFVVLTIASPILLLYGFFSTEWLIEDLTNRTAESKDLYSKSYRTTIKPSGQIRAFGLYKKCDQTGCIDEILDKTTFGLEVTSVIFQFLAILALPWIKYCFPQNKCLKYWNCCFLPFMLVAGGTKMELRLGFGDCAIMSLSGSLYYSNKSNLYQERTPTGKSLVCAGIGGGFQIILAAVIGYFFWKHGLLPCNRRARKDSEYIEETPGTSKGTSPKPPPPSTSRASSSFHKTEHFLLQIFTYDLSNMGITAAAVVWNLKLPGNTD